MTLVRKMELRDIGPVLQLMEDMAIRSKSLGCTYFNMIPSIRQNGFVETLKSGLDNPDFSLLLVGEYKGEIVAAMAAHLCRNYPYAMNQTDAFVPSMWFKKGIYPYIAGKILQTGIAELRKFSKEKDCGVVFGNTYHADERARKLMRHMGFKATFIRYEAEV